MTNRSGLDQLLEVLRWRWATILLVAVPVIVGAAAYAQVLPTYYEARALVSVEPRTDADDPVGADVVRLGAPTFVSYATAPATLEQVAEELGRAPGALGAAVRVEIEPDTATIEIIAEDSSPARAAETANAVAAQLQDFRDTQAGSLLTVAPVAEAVPPSAAAGPPRRLLVALATVLGAGLGLGVAVVREAREERLRTTAEIEAVTGSSVLGALPRVRRLPDQPAAAFRDPAVGTAIRSVRVVLEGALSRHATLAVTSATPREGKSTVAALLATALARLDLRVLLVDGDVRQAGLTRAHFGSVEHGFLGVLHGRAALRNEIRPGWEPTLSLLPTRTDVDAGDVLSQRLGPLEHELNQAHDVVIFDTPPMLGSDEARVLTGAARATLLVVAAGQPAGDVAAAIAGLGTARAGLIGVLANRISPGHVPDPYALVRAQGRLDEGPRDSAPSTAPFPDVAQRHRA